MILLLVIVFVILLLVILFVISKNKGFEINQSGINLFKPLDECQANQKFLELPLVYDPMNGIYRTKIKLGNNNQNYVEFDVVPDLGSSILIVAGPNCRLCDPRDGVWRFNLGEDISEGKIATIRYGSQATVYRPWQAELLNYPGGKQVNFGVIVDSQSVDNKPLNVMGLTNRANGFLEGLCGKKIITFDFTQEKLLLGEVNLTNIKHTIDFIESPSGPEFVMSKIKDIKINGKSVPKQTLVKYAIWDTGATDSFIPGSLYNEFNKYKGKYLVEITFDNNQTISFTSEPKNISRGQLPVDQSMLIGNYWMRQHNFSINHEDMVVNVF